jgi:YD repeat-containing protein
MIVTAFVACEKNKNEVTPRSVTDSVPAPNASVQKCYLTKMEGTGGRVYSFRYDANDKLTGAELIYPKRQAKYVRRTFSIERNGANQIARVINDNYDTLNKQVNTIVYTYQYDAAGKLTSFYVNDNPSAPTLLTFDRNQQLLKIAHPSGGYEEFSYDGKGNFIKLNVKFSNNDPFFSEEYFKNDDHKNPFTGLGDFFFLIGFSAYSVSNPLETTVSGNGKKTNSVSFTYTYNAEGYPITSTSVNTSVYETVGTLTEHITYQYHCK